MSIPKDTLILNQELIEKWKDQGYEYDRDLKLEKKKETHTTKDTSYNFEKNYNTFSVTMSIILVFVFVIGISYFFYKNYSTEVKVEDGITDEDTIYGIDFDTSITDMEKAENYFQCIRLKYLQLLRQLHDDKKIFWALAKTPTQYTYEFKISEFKTLTNIFMKIRYGNYPASKSLYQEFCELYDVVISSKGGER